MKVLILTVKGNGTRAISRSLGISQNTATAILRSIEKDLWYVGYNYLEKNQNTGVDLALAEESEMDEMRSYFGDKDHQIWLWWAIDHNAGDVLALFPKLGTRYVVRYF
jgi:hypothetical protein